MRHLAFEEVYAIVVGVYSAINADAGAMASEHVLKRFDPERFRMPQLTETKMQAVHVSMIGFYPSST